MKKFIGLMVLVLCMGAETSFGFAIPNDTETKTTFTSIMKTDSINFDFVSSEKVNVFKIAEINTTDVFIIDSCVSFNSFVLGTLLENDLAYLEKNYKLFINAINLNQPLIHIRPAWYNLNMNSCYNKINFGNSCLCLLERPAWRLNINC